MYQAGITPMTVKDIKSSIDVDRLYIEQTIIANACRDQRTCANCDYRRHKACLGTIITDRILELTRQEFEDKLNDPDYVKNLEPRTIEAMRNLLDKKEDSKEESQ